MADPVSLSMIASSAGSTASGIGQGIYGYIQQKRANEELAKLKEPARYIPSAIRQRAAEPIAEEYIVMQQEGLNRRTAQSLDTLKSAGARGVLGGLQGVVDQERMAERQMAGEYEQERRSAMRDLGRAEIDLQNARMSDYLDKVAAVRGLAEAGAQNMMGGFQSMMRGSQDTAGIMAQNPNSLGGGVRRKQQLTYGDVYPEETISYTPKGFN